MADQTDPSTESALVLGVSVDTNRISAAVLGADGAVHPLALGDDQLSIAAAVSQSPDGAVMVGDAALRSSGPIATDPMERARVGRVGALTAVLAHVMGRAAAAAGSTPRRIALVVPDHWTRDERDRLVEIGASAGAADTTLIPLSAAAARRSDPEDPVAMASAAAVIARASDAPPPIVTREDLGGSPDSEAVKPPDRVPAPPSGPRSVFDPVTDGPKPPPPSTPRPAVAGGISSAPDAEPTRAMPAVSSPIGPPTHRPVPERRAPVGLIIALVVLVLAGAAIGAIALAKGGTTTAAPATTTLTTTVATTTVPTTTAPATTEPTTTTTEAPTTSSTSSTTSSTTTSTTTLPVPVGEPGPVTLVETGLQLDTGAVLTFEQDDASVIAALEAALGPADLDSAWYLTSFCIGARTRILNWGDLEVVFTEDVLDSGVGKFTQWFVDGITNPVGLVTIDGLGYGATVGFLEMRYGTAATIVEAIPDDPAGLFAVTNPASGGVLLGVTTTRDPNGVVTSMWAGDSCTRIYT